MPILENDIFKKAMILVTAIDSGALDYREWTAG